MDDEPQVMSHWLKFSIRHMRHWIRCSYLCCLALLLFSGFSCHAQVKITDGATRAGQECYRIETSSATYLYQKEAGGFSNIHDSQGTDWIQFNKLAEAKFPASAAADYRGLPNMVFKSDDGGAGHPGFDKMNSELVGDAEIRSTSKSGKWQWSWVFYDNYAELTVEKVDKDHAYWFLYEGPIAGKFSPSTHYWGTDVSGPLTKQPDLYKGPEHSGNWQTVYFGDSNYSKTFFVTQLSADSLTDHYTYLGNSDKGNDSEDGMVVFGFGRAPKATPLFTQPHKFRIGFYEGKIENSDDHQLILKYIEKLEP